MSKIYLRKLEVGFKHQATHSGNMARWEVVGAKRSLTEMLLDDVGTPRSIYSVAKFFTFQARPVGSSPGVPFVQLAISLNEVQWISLSDPIEVTE